MRLPIAYTLGNRGETTDTNGKLQNGFAEVDGDIIRAYKRPGMTSSYSVTTGAASSTPTLGQGLFAWQLPNAPGVTSAAYLMAIRGDTLTSGI